MPAAESILVTKLHIPRPRSRTTLRPRLTARLNAAHALTLLCAPPGFGKTTLLSEWIPAQAQCVCWLSLDDGDNDPVRFWQYVIAALQTLDAQIGATALMLLQSPQPPPIGSILTVLLNDLSTFPDRFSLVLDDYHFITAPAIHESVTFLIDHLPPQVQLMITSRIDPPLPLARWRARGQLAEVRAAELRFTPDETAAFLDRVMGLTLTAAEAAALEQHTEGWVAGLQLAALSMQGRDDAASFVDAFTGSHRFILDYLVEEVLNRQPPETLRFLLHTSILDRLSGPLCDAVTGLFGSQALLEQLEHANLFIVPLDDRREWFRYHHLFADVLRERLRGTQPEAVPTLHRRASVWHQQAGAAAEAVRHALAAPDFDRAARLVEITAWELIGRGELTTLHAWLDRLPPATVQARPRLGLAYATLLSIANQMDALEARLKDVDAALADEPLHRDEDSLDDRAALLGQTAALRAHMALEKYEDPWRAVELSRQALAHIPDNDTLMRSLVMYYLGSAQRYSGDAAAAVQTLTEGASLALAAGNPLYTLVFFEAKANVEKAQGKLHEAAATCEQSRELTISRAWHAHPNAVNARIGLGMLRYEWNEVEAAAQIFRENLEWTRRWGMRFNEVKTCVLLASMPPAQCDPAEARVLIQQAAQIARDWNRPYVLRLVEHYAARLALRQGNLDQAVRWAGASGRSADDSVLLYQHEEEYLSLARVRIAQGQCVEALRLLDRLLLAAEADARLGSVIEIQMLRSLALQAQAARADAVAALERALALAEPEGYIRTFVDEGEPIRLLLERVKAAPGGPPPHNGGHGQGGRMKPYASTLLDAFEVRQGPLHPSSLILQPLVEPLSDRELEVLRLIADGLSNREIAEQLIVGTGTVKTHINNIYRKLDVNSRTQAIHRARELGLL